MTAYLQNYRKSTTHVKYEKKFTCKEEEYDRTYDTPMFIFKLIGIRLNKKDSDFAKLCWNIYYWFEFLNMFIAMSLELVNMAVTERGGTFEDDIQIFIMVPCVGYAALAMINCYKIVSHREVYEELVKELRNMYPQGEVPEEDHQIITKATTRVNYVVRGYYYSNAILLIAYMSRPYIAALKRFLGHEAPKELLLLYYFPFDPYQSVVFEVITVVQTWQGTVAVLSLQCGVMMFCILLSHIAMQFDLLSLRVQRLIRVSTDKQLPATFPLSKYSNVNRLNHITSDNEMDNKVFQELYEIILRHRALIRLAGTVEDLMSLPLLLNFCNSTIIICFCGFCAVLVEKANDVVYKTFLVTTLMQTWLLCSYGQRLLEASLGFSDALYTCGWYRTTKRNCKTIFIMMHRSQKAVRITTYGFQTILCLATYTTVIKTAWSYMSLLLNVYK